MKRRLSQLMVEDGKHKELTEQIIMAFYKVYNELGHGFLEKVYQNSLYIELKRMGLNVEPVSYTHLDVYKRQVICSFLSKTTLK